MTTFLLTLVVMLLAAAGLALGIFFGRKPPKGSCGGLGSLGLECHAGCDKPCPRRQARMAALQQQTQDHATQ